MIRGTKRPMEKKSPAVNTDLRASIHNRFDLELVDAQTGEVKNKAVGYNVICNRLWSKLLSTSWAYFQYIHYGSGSGTPSESDTSLFSFVGAKAIATTNTNTTNHVMPSISWDFENGVYSITHKIVLGTTDAVGVTITEIGIGDSSSSSGLCTHAMLQDMNGNQISITKSDTDVLNIYATVFVRYDNTGAGGVRVCPPPDKIRGGYYTKYGTDGLFGWLSGSSVSYYDAERKYPVYAVLQNNMLPLKGFSSGSSYYTNYPATLTPSFDVANKRVTLTASRFSNANNNTPGGYKYVGLYSHGSTESSYGTQTGLAGLDILIEAGEGNMVSGSEIMGEAIGTGDGSTVDFRTSFPNAYDCTILVDGAEANGVVVENKNHILNPYGYVRNDFMRIRPESTPDNLIFYNDTDCSDYEELIVGSEEDKNSLRIFFGRNNDSQPSPLYVYLYNKNHAEGISQMYIHSGYYGNPTVEASNDLSSWTTISSNTPIPEDLQHCKFFRLGTTYSSNSQACPSIYKIKRPADFSEYNVHFSAPPAAGAVITANYKTPVIAKDANHVFDLTVTIQLGEFNPDA